MSDPMLEAGDLEDAREGKDKMSESRQVEARA